MINKKSRGIWLTRRCSEENKKKRRKRESERQNSEICLRKSANFDRTLRAFREEPDDESYVNGKLRMLAFHSILRFMNNIFLEDVMTNLLPEGQSVCESDS